MSRRHILKLLMMMILPVVLLSLPPPHYQSGDLGWVVACEVSDNQSAASATAAELAILTNSEKGFSGFPTGLLFPITTAGWFTWVLSRRKL